MVARIESTLSLYLSDWYFKLASMNIETKIDLILTSRTAQRGENKALFLSSPNLTRKPIASLFRITGSLGNDTLNCKYRQRRHV